MILHFDSVVGRARLPCNPVGHHLSSRGNPLQPRCSQVPNSQCSIFCPEYIFAHLIWISCDIRTVLPWEAIFCKKNAWKTAFLADTKSDQLTLSSHNSCSKPQNLKNYHIFGILQTSAFRWAIGNAAGVNIVRTAGRYVAQGGRTEKIAKNWIFCFFRFSSKILWRKFLPG